MRERSKMDNWGETLYLAGKVIKVPVKVLLRFVLGLVNEWCHYHWQEFLLQREQDK